MWGRLASFCYKIPGIIPLRFSLLNTQRYGHDSKIKITQILHSDKSGIACLLHPISTFYHKPPGLLCFACFSIDPFSWYKDQCRVIYIPLFHASFHISSSVFEGRLGRKTKGSVSRPVGFSTISSTLLPLALQAHWLWVPASCIMNRASNQALDSFQFDKWQF
jgi:hypothetical protein